MNFKMFFLSLLILGASPYIRLVDFCFGVIGIEQIRKSSAPMLTGRTAAAIS